MSQPPRTAIFLEPLKHTDEHGKLECVPVRTGQFTGLSGLWCRQNKILASMEVMRNHLELGISEALAKNDRKRQAAWTEGLAVGSQGFVEAARGWISSRQKTEVTAQENDLWVLHDEEVPYTAKMNAKESSKGPIFNE